MKANGKMKSEVVKVHATTLMEKNTKESGKKIRRMEEVDL